MVSLRIFGHCFRISSVRLHLFSISFYGLSYSHADTRSITCNHVKIGVQLPNMSNLTFLTVAVYDYEFRNLQHHVSLSKLHLDVHLFPIAPETFISIVLDDFRARITTSQNTPPWLQTLRQNLIRTVLNGKHIRLDDIQTKIILCTRGVRGTTRTFPDSEDEDTKELEKSAASPISPEDTAEMQNTTDEESVVTLNASNWHIKGARRRLYRFASIDAQLRRAWDPDVDRGSLVFIAKDSSWVLAPDSVPLTPPLKMGSTHDPRWLVYFHRHVPFNFITCTMSDSSSRFFDTPLFLLKTVLSVPSSIIKAIHDPASALTLHIPRIDVTFDRFRLRDAELVRQLCETTYRRYDALKESDDANIRGFVEDMMMSTILGDSRKKEIW
ncbi:hypothetical protein DXG01_002098 [Tephrocybe rancida]|nr:hypothetical protein DXG01_002098 [Tephrocybe rancida]